MYGSTTPWQVGTSVPLEYIPRAACLLVQYTAICPHKCATILFSSSISRWEYFYTMAEASCGPSNSLQRFQKHTSVDRTLQQDRLATRELLRQVTYNLSFYPILQVLTQIFQGFRSSSNKTAGSLDAEYEVFRTGSPLDSAPEPQEPLGPYGPINPVAPVFVSPLVPNWASDFQSLHLNDVSAQSKSQSQIEEQVGLQSEFIDKWYEQPAHNAIPTMSRYMMSNGLPKFRHQQHQPLSLGAQQAPIRQPHEELFDAEALDRAFEAVHAELEESEEQLRAELAEYGQATRFSNEGAIRSPILHGRPLTKPIGSDRFSKTTSQEKQEQFEIDENDKLARAAGELLEKVADHQDRKFQDSNFLSFMRQLRDREVQVKGDMIVGVSVIRASLHSKSNQISKPSSKKISLTHLRFLSLFIPAGSSIQRDGAGSRMFRQIHSPKNEPEDCSANL